MTVPGGPVGGRRRAAAAAARARHPTARAWPADRRRMLERLAARAAGRGAPWPRVAAAVVLLRGVAGDDRATFARRIRLSETDLASLEAGEVPAAAVPPRLRAVPGLVDWAWVEEGATGP
ncbi:MAG TPA: hypothetical protein VFZ77_06765 [Acidimicrobiales bacterium]